MGIWRFADGGSISFADFQFAVVKRQSKRWLACGRQEQNWRNAQLVTIYRGQPVNSHTRRA